MKALVVYDSMFGNTEKIAKAIGAGLAGRGDVEVVKLGSRTLDELKGIDLLLVGSPTQKFRPLPAMSDWLKLIANGELKGKRVAVFDTRMTLENVQKVRVLAFMVSIFGYAVGAMEKTLKKAGCTLAAPGEGFYIVDTEGPLVDGELERATAWAENLI